MIHITNHPCHSSLHPSHPQDLVSTLTDSHPWSTFHVPCSLDPVQSMSPLKWSNQHRLITAVQVTMKIINPTSCSSSLVYHNDHYEVKITSARPRASAAPASAAPTSRIRSAFPWNIKISALPWNICFLKYLFPRYVKGAFPWYIYFLKYFGPYHHSSNIQRAARNLCVCG